MRSPILKTILAFGIWFGGAGAHLQATESAPADVYDYAGRFRLGNDGVLTFFVTCGELYMNTLTKGEYALQAESQNRFRAKGSDLVITFHNTRVVEISRQGGAYDALAVRMAEGEKVPLEHIMDGEFDEAIRGYLVHYESDPAMIQERRQQIATTANRLRGEGRLDEAVVLMNVLAMVYPEESVIFGALGDVYLTLAIAQYKEWARLSGEVDSITPALEYLLEQQR